jgi:hypothetical protein
MVKSKMTITVSDVVEYLENRMQSASISESEEALYIDYQNYGEEALRFDEHRGTLVRIVKRIKREYGIA